ncbi:MAG: hypothetical protein ABUL72_04750, partial [Armatimonadota bacterium]
MFGAFLLARVLLQEPKPAFVDGPHLIHFAVESPLRLKDVVGHVKVTVGKQTVTVTSVEGAGQSERLRTAPREAGRVVLPGTIQGALGEKEWDPDGETTLMTRLSDGVYGLVVELPKGHFKYKVARNGSWAENWGQKFTPGGTDIEIDVPADHTVVHFLVNFNTKTISDSISDPTLA